MKKGIKKLLGWGVLVLLFMGLNVGMFYLYGGAENGGRALLYVFGFYAAFFVIIGLVYLIAWAISLIQN